MSLAAVRCSFDAILCHVLPRFAPNRPNTLPSDLTQCWYCQHCQYCAGIGPNATLQRARRLRQAGR